MAYELRISDWSSDVCSSDLSLKFDALKQLARLYWYTVEFGLIREAGGLRIYGAGIVSSFAESVFALDSKSPNRIGFDLARVMRTDYRRSEEHTSELQSLMRISYDVF